MKPVAIFRASPTEGPGYFATYLERRSIPWQLVALDSGERVPRDARKYSGLVFMGGPMSVNDDLPWIAPALELARDGVRKDVPLLGHCLGGQLISKALGGTVGTAPVKEIGWGEVHVADNEVAREWLGDLQTFLSFHWHGETFTLPPGAKRGASSRVISSGSCTAGLRRLAAISSAPLASQLVTSSSVISTWHCMPKCLPSAKPWLAQCGLCMTRVAPGGMVKVSPCQ